ncbi:MAG: hypothetical protein JWQ40_2971 [Segetibacter sp.]|nr:hypothetical protein [Segetibacter sp.]
MSPFRTDLFLILVLYFPFLILLQSCTTKKEIVTPTVQTNTGFSITTNADTIPTATNDSLPTKADDSPVTPHVDTLPSLSMTTDKILNFTGLKGNNQGLLYNNKRIMLAYDIGGGNNRLVIYDYFTGAVLKEVPSLRIGHGAEIKYHKQNKLLFAINGGGGTLTHVYTVDIESTKPSILRDYNLEQLGKAGIIALDEANNKFYVLSSATGDLGTHLITPVDIVTGIPDLSNQFRLPNLGIPQGAVFHKGRIYFLLGKNSTIIAAINPATKSLEKVVTMPDTAEPEGLDIVDDIYSYPKFVVGYVGSKVYTYNLRF